MRTTEKDYSSPSGALKELMQQHAAYLNSQTGHHDESCMDCCFDIPRKELYATCPICKSAICIRCIDDHEFRKHLNIQ